MPDVSSTSTKILNRAIRPCFEFLGYLSTLMTFAVFILPNHSLVILQRIEKMLMERSNSAPVVRVNFNEFWQSRNDNETMLRYYNNSSHEPVGNVEISIYHTEDGAPNLLYKTEDYLDVFAERTIMDIGVYKPLSHKAYMCIRYLDLDKIELLTLEPEIRESMVVYSHRSRPQFFTADEAATCDQAVQESG